MTMVICGDVKTNLRGPMGDGVDELIYYVHTTTACNYLFASIRNSSSKKDWVNLSEWLFSIYLLARYRQVCPIRDLKYIVIMKTAVLWLQYYW